MVVVRSERIVRCIEAGIDACRRGHRLLDLLDRLDDVDAGLLEDDEEDVALAVAPRRLGVVGGPVDRFADVADADRRAIAIGDDDVVPCLGVRELVVVEDGEGLPDAVDRALGAVDRGLSDLPADVLELEVLLDELGRVDLDRTAGCCWPATRTSDTPEIWLNCWARMFSVASSTSVIGAVSEETERMRIGASDGLTLR